MVNVDLKVIVLPCRHKAQSSMSVYECSSKLLVGLKMSTLTRPLVIGHPNNGSAISFVTGPRHFSITNTKVYFYLFTCSRTVLVIGLRVLSIECWPFLDLKDIFNLARYCVLTDYENGLLFYYEKLLISVLICFNLCAPVCVI